jgi:RimJ/RimL family protein N-acetyltransferase
MLHDIVLDGYAFRLRPVTDTDAEFILELRSDPGLNRYLHTTSGKLSDQLHWLEAYYGRQNDYYFVIERIEGCAPEGVIAVYDIDTDKLTGEWGRWIVRPGSLAGVESAWLIYRCAFERLNLKSVYCRTVADNMQVVSFHDSCGIRNKKLLPEFFNIDNELYDAVEHCLNDFEWEPVNNRLARLAQLTSRRLNRD